MNVEIGAEAAPFPEKEYINWIAVAVCLLKWLGVYRKHLELCTSPKVKSMLVRLYRSLCIDFLYLWKQESFQN